MEADIFEKLKSLQEVLYKKFQVEKEIEEIPRALNIKEEMVTRLKKSYVDKSGYVTKKKARLANLNLRLQEIEENRLKYEKNMDEISTQREYELLDKQIKEASETEQKIRKDIKKEEFELNDLLETLKHSEELIAQNEAEYNSEKDKINLVIEEKEKELQSLKKEEDAITPGLSEDILFKFDRIIRNKEGKGIVPISDRVCSGCHMQLPAQFANDVRSGKEIQFCPYCSRILYFEQSDNVVEDFAFSDVDAGGLASFVNDDDFEEV